MRITNGTLACDFPLENDAAIAWGTTGNLLFDAGWAFMPTKDGKEPKIKKASVSKTAEVIEIILPEAFFEGNREVIAYEWLK